MYVLVVFCYIDAKFKFHLKLNKTKCFKCKCAHKNKYSYIQCKLIWFY